MEFSVFQLFDHLLSSSLDNPLSLTSLQEQLLVSTPQQEAELQIALQALERLGFLATVGDPPQFYRKADDTLVVGRLRCNSKGYGFAIRDEPGVEDIYIHGTNLNGAWNGDQVLARITKDAYRKKSPEGEVAAVIERANPTLVARLKQVEDGFRAQPLDDRLLFEMVIQSAGEKEASAVATDERGSPLEDGKSAYIEVLRYPLADHLPIGRVRKVLGSGLDASIDIDLVCCKYDLPQTFPQVMLEGTTLPNKISKSELKKRQDFRDWLTLTIEPLDLHHPHSMEPNVALSLGAADDNGWQLGVHVADVAHWIAAASPLDIEAEKRAVAVYLDTCVLPLFPPHVNQHCALLPEQERLTLSILLDLSAEGNLLSFEIHPGVIQPRAHLSYGQVQTLLMNAEETSAPGDDTPELLALLQNLQTVSGILRHRRHQHHGFEMAMAELVTPTSATESRSGALIISPNQVAHAMLHEFMLVANQALGTHLQQLGVPHLSRVQPPPSAESLQGFLRLAGNMHLDLALTDPNQVDPADWQRFVQRIQKPDVVELGANPALEEQLLSVLPPAVYRVDPGAEDEPGIHFGLGLSQPYCHATAPLHRYADLLNQRILHLIFDKGRDRRSTRVKKGVDLHSSSSHGQINWSVLPPKVHDEYLNVLQSKVDLLNQQHQVARQAERELIGLKKSEFMQKHLGETFPGLIIGVQKYGFFVAVDPIQAEGLVHVSSLKNDWFEYRSRQQALVGRKSRRQFQLGDRVEVRIKNVDYYRQQIDLEVVGEGRESDEEEERL
jgi:ribonuclease R